MPARSYSRPIRTTCRALAFCAGAAHTCPKALYVGTSCAPFDLGAASLERLAALGWQSDPVSEDGIRKERGAEVLEAAAYGHPSRHIAMAIGVKEEIAKTHLKWISAALGAHGRTHALVLLMSATLCRRCLGSDTDRQRFSVKALLAPRRASARPVPLRGPGVSACLLPAFPTKPLSRRSSGFSLQVVDTDDIRLQTVVGGPGSLLVLMPVRPMI